MTKKFNDNQQDEGHSFNYSFTTLWVSHIISTLTAGITMAVTIAITIIVSLLTIVGGLWLANTYLSRNVFNIVVLILLADILLGVIVRLVLSRRNQADKSQ